MKENSLPRFPKVLADELNSAIREVHDIGIGTEKVIEFLARLKRIQTKRIATWGLRGLSNTGSAISDLESIPEQIVRLYIAFQKLHRYNHGGAADYVSAGVGKEIASIYGQMSKRGRAEYGNELVDRKDRNLRIVEYALRYGYITSNDKKSIISAIEKHFKNNNESVSRATIYRVLAEFGLTRKKK